MSRAADELLNGRIIAFNTAIARMSGSALAGLFISQAIWESKQTSTGWFFKTQAEWYRDTMMTRREQDTARADLKKLGFLEELRDCNPPRKMLYRVNRDAIKDALDNLCNTALGGEPLDDETHQCGASVHTGAYNGGALYARDINRLTSAGLPITDKEREIDSVRGLTESGSLINSPLIENQESSRTRVNGSAVPPKVPRKTAVLGDDTAQPNATALYIDAYRAATFDLYKAEGITPTLGGHEHKKLKDYMTLCKSPQAYADALRGFFGDQWARGANFTVSALCGRQPDGWWGIVQQKAKGPQSEEDFKEITRKALAEKWSWEED